MSDECPICMEPMDETCNKTITKCGHSFHSSCIFQNMASRNGFGCPYCRSTLAEEIEDSDSESDYDDEFIRLEEEDNALYSFRLFHQRINNEELEEEYVNPYRDEEAEEEADEEAADEEAAKINYVVQHLNNQGITYKELVTYILNIDHFDMYDGAFDNSSSVIYGQTRRALNQFDRLIDEN